MSEPTTRLIVAKRHWMHIWKVGHKPCAVCHADSRVIATLLDRDGAYVSETHYCEKHAPELSELESTGSVLGDAVRDITFGLGASFSVTDEV